MLLGKKNLGECLITDSDKGIKTLALSKCTTIRQECQGVDERRRDQCLLELLLDQSFIVYFKIRYHTCNNAGKVVCRPL